jgi:hypothetical protein
MIKQICVLCCVGLAVMFADIRAVRVEASIPDLSGTYRCIPDTRLCQSATFAVSQRGAKLDVRSEQGDFGTGEVTSAISVNLGPPWNVLGTILPDQRTIEWSAGTRWQRQ